MSEQYLLDTHAWLWLLRDEEKLSLHTRSLLVQLQAESRLFLPAFAIWEVSQKESAGRLQVSGGLDALMRESFDDGELQLAELSVAVLILANRLPGRFHGDPADRIIVATAMHSGRTLLTHDDQILRYAEEGHLKTARI